MSVLFFRYGTYRYLSVFTTKVRSTSSHHSKAESVAPPTKLSDEKYIQVYEQAEDVDQKRVTLPVNRDLYSSSTVTHTGQVYEHDDYRNVRFTNKGKLVC